MQAKHRVSSAQFFIMMFVSRVIVTIALNEQYLGGENMLDNIVSYGLSMVVGFLIALPVWILNKRHPEQSVIDVAKSVLGRAGRFVPVLYVVYLILVNSVSLSLFEIFLMDTVNPDFSSVWIVASILGVALFGAFRGIETVSRCAVCVFVILLAGTLLVFGIVAMRFEPANLEPLFTNGFRQTLHGIFLFIARTSIFADMAILLPMVNGNKVKGFCWWSLGTFAFVSVLILLIVGCLGRYAYTQNFPVYVLAAITEVRSMQRLDAVFIGVWMMGLIVRLACDLYACRVCFSALQEHRKPKLSVVVTVGCILPLTLATSRYLQLQRVVLNTGALFFITVGVCFLIPLLLLLADALRKKGKGSVGG